MNIGFIGTGNMGGAILKGFISSFEDAQNNYYICGRDMGKTRKKGAELGASVCENIGQLVKASDIFFIGVKPKDFVTVLAEIKPEMTDDKICISMAAGITLKVIGESIGLNSKIIRIMPNTPAQVGQVMVSVSKNENVTEEECKEFVGMFSGMGSAAVVDEELIHGVIGISGSSPAYTYMYIEALQNIGIKNGISPEKARIFAAQAVLGAAKMVLESDTDLGTLVDNVCSPGGTTIEAVELLRKEGFEEMVERGAQAAIDKSILMSK